MSAHVRLGDSAAYGATLSHTPAQRPAIEVWSPPPCCCRPFSPPTLSRPDQILVPNRAVQVNLKYRPQLYPFCDQADLNQSMLVASSIQIDDRGTIRDLGRPGDLIHFVGA